MSCPECGGLTSLETNSVQVAPPTVVQVFPEGDLIRLDVDHLRSTIGSLCSKDPESLPGDPRVWSILSMPVPRDVLFDRTASTRAQGVRSRHLRDLHPGRHSL
jgi:hypothetical protein